MKKSKVKRRNGRRRRSRLNPLTTIFLGIAVVLACVWSWQLLQSDMAAEEEKALLLLQKDQLVQANADLRQEIELLNTPSYIEQMAREKLGLVRKGEILLAPKEEIE